MIHSARSTTLWAGAAFLVLIGLGTWQLERLHWKNTLIAQRQAALNADPVAPPQTMDDARALAFRPVRVSGVFLNDREMPVAAIAKDGQAGFEIVTPMLVGAKTILLVDRGFVPTQVKDQQARLAGLINGPTTITGLVRTDGGKPSWFTPDNVPLKNTWYYIDVMTMGKAATPEGDIVPYYLSADATLNEGGWPQGGQFVVDLPNNHLQYAITWYALAVALAVVYVVYMRRRRAPAPSVDAP